MNTEPYLKNITVPTLIIHSKEDPIQGIEGVHTIFKEISSTDKEYKEYPGNSHCCMDQHESASSYAADWMKNKIKELKVKNF